MPNIDTPTIQRLFDQGEKSLSIERSWLVDRYAIPLVNNVRTYILPDFVISIKRITYQGTSLDPLPQRNFREVFQSASQLGEPFWYIFNNTGRNMIQLFPIPNTNVSAPSGDLWGFNAINTGCIVEFYRSTDGINFTVLPYLRRQLMKRYVAWMSTLIEGPNQDLKAATYYKAQWQTWKTQYFNHLKELHGKARKILTDDIVPSTYFPAPPILPINRFGISVDEGY